MPHSAAHAKSLLLRIYLARTIEARFEEQRLVVAEKQHKHDGCRVCRRFLVASSLLFLVVAGLVLLGEVLILLPWGIS